MTVRPFHQKVAVSCLSCDWYSARLDADGSCPRCGGSLRTGYPTNAQPRRRIVATGRFGEVSEDVQARVDAALAKNRRDAIDG